MSRRYSEQRFLTAASAISQLVVLLLCCFLLQGGQLRHVVEEVLTTAKVVLNDEAIKLLREKVADGSLDTIVLGVIYASEILLTSSLTALASLSIKQHWLAPWLLLPRIVTGVFTAVLPVGLYIIATTWGPITWSSPLLAAHLAILLFLTHFLLLDLFHLESLARRVRAAGRGLAVWGRLLPDLEGDRVMLVTDRGHRMVSEPAKNYTWTLSGQWTVTVIYPSVKYILHPGEPKG
jgi:hypothetical protein